MTNDLKSSRNAVEECATEICERFDKGSPFAFLSPPEDADQIFVGLGEGKLAKGRLCSIAKDDRTTLIGALTARGREVSDTGYGNTLSPALKAMYAADRITQKKWFDIPYRIKRAFVALHSDSADSDPS